MSGKAGEVLWRAGARRRAQSHLQHFLDYLLAQGFAQYADYEALHAWSVREPAEFWSAFARFADVRFAQQPSAVLCEPAAMPGARWFAGSRLSFAAHLLRRDDDSPALILRNEAGERRELSWRALRRQVAGVQAGLQQAGLEPGDRVAALLPNQPETVILMLAVAGLGGVWSSCSPDFGAPGVLERFGQIAPKLLFATDGYHYAGKRLDIRSTVRELAGALPSVGKIVIVPGLDAAAAIDQIPGAVRLADFIDPAATEPICRALPFDHPLYILYSSGTTGAPKCIVHGAGGTLLTHLKEQLLHVDLQRADRLFYFTTCGWMMWNWLVSGLAAGATLVLYEGSPMHPDPGVLWRMAEEEGVTVFGTSARYLAALEQAGYRPREQHQTGQLRTLLSTGSPLLPASFDFVYRAISADVHLASIAGGTDLVGCFLIGNPLLAVRRGELQCAALGMAVGVASEEGRLLAGPARGELVCTRPFPSMPVGFWNDPDRSRYERAYFRRFPGWWTHGDDVERRPSGGYLIHGRSDAVLNPGGVRIGTAEIYRELAHLPEVVEGLAIGQEHAGDTRIVLFVQLSEGVVLDESLQARIRAQIRHGASPRHVPAVIVAVPELPRTRSGKLVELAVRAVVHGREPGNLEALANPEALAHFRDWAALDD